MTSALLSAIPARTGALRCANLEILPPMRQVLVGGRPIEFNGREFQLLLALAERRNRVVRRAELYELVRGGRMAYRDRSVDVLVRRLRGKLDAAAPGWIYIHTHVRVGYRFAPQRHA